MKYCIGFNVTYTYMDILHNRRARVSIHGATSSGTIVTLLPDEQELYVVTRNASFKLTLNRVEPIQDHGLLW